MSAMPGPTAPGTIVLIHGLGAAGVAIHPAPVKGVLRLPLASLRSAFPVLRNPANRHRTVVLTPEQWRYGFTNTLSEQDSRRLYDRYQVPSPGRPHFTMGVPGWEEVADYALEWATQNAGAAARSRTIG